MKKDAITQYFRMIFILAALCLLCSCVDRIAEKPTFTLKEVSLKLHSMKELKALLTVEVKNPNNYALNFKSLEYHFLLDNQEAGKGIYAEPFQVPPSSARTVTIPLTMEFDGMDSCIKSFIRGKDIPYKVEGNFRLKLLWGSIKIPFAKEGHFNIKS
ncbi:MAG: LEA type 2 family protein [Deltaproteobacteria bacterium]|nr:LEA type 2 family protein [Deltaproteobacteria bacterium]